MDINAFKLEESHDLVIRRPDDYKETEIVFHLRSMESKEVKAVQRKWETIASKNRTKALTPAQQDEYVLDIMGAAIIGWDGINKDGKPFEVTPENKRYILDEKDVFWIRDQIADEVTAKNNFLSQTGSK